MVDVQNLPIDDPQSNQNKDADVDVENNDNVEVRGGNNSDVYTMYVNYIIGGNIRNTGNDDEHL